MKKILFITLFFLGTIFAFTGCKQDKGANAFNSTGSVLTYHLTSSSDSYDFIISDLKMDEDISFTWKMTEPLNYTGTVKMTGDALEESTKIVNYFSDGSSQEMTSKTTIWLSRKVYKALKDKKPIDLHIDGFAEPINFVTNEKYKFTLNGADHEVDVLVAESEYGSKLWILDDKDYPLIIKMELDFTIELVSATTK